jgi:hypothetical protein
MVVDPAAPLVEVLGTALIGNRTQRPDSHFGVHRHVDVSDFARLGVFVPQSDVTATPRDESISEASQDGDDLTAGERRPDHQLLQEVREFSVTVDLVRIDIEFFSEESVGIVDRLATSLVEFENLGELRECLGTGVATTSEPCLEVSRGDTAVVLADEDHTLRLVTVAGCTRHYRIIGRTLLIRVRPGRGDTSATERVPSRRVLVLFVSVRAGRQE